MKKLNKRKLKEFRFQAIIEIAMVILLFFSFVPIILMLFLSSKTTWEIYNNFFGLPKKFAWENYLEAFDFMKDNMINTFAIVAIAVVLTLVLCTMGGYVFATKNFPGKEVLYMLIMAVMMIPGSLSLAANYTLILDYGLFNSRWAVILPWVTTGQIMGIILSRNSIEALPQDLFEAAKMEGCGEMRLLCNITVPLIKPILSTVAVMNIVSNYNSFIWPMMVIESNSKQVISVVLKVFTSSTDSGNMGMMYAGFVIAMIPLLVLFIFTSRLYMEGLTAGAVKG